MKIIPHQPFINNQTRNMRIQILAKISPEGSDFPQDLRLHRHNESPLTVSFERSSTSSQIENPLDSQVTHISKALVRKT